MNAIGFKEGIDIDVLRWASDLTVKPTGQYLFHLSNLVKKLKSKGIWNKLDRFCLFATEQQQHAQKDIKDSRHLSLTEVNSPTWTRLQGYLGNGSSSYLSLAFNPFNVSTQKWQLNSATFGFYSRTNIAENRNSGVLDGSGNGLILGPRNAVNLLAGRINSVSTGNVTAANSDSRGLFVINRSASNAQQIYKNGIQLSSNTASSFTIVNRGIFLLARNNNGTADLFENIQTSMAYMGSSLTSDEQLYFYNEFQKFATIFGFNV